MTTPAISIKNLRYDLRNHWTFQPTSILKGINLTIAEGEAFGFLGANGAGKTTTIKCLLNLLRPTSGTISLLGRSSQSREARGDIGYVPEQPYFYDYSTVFEALHFYATLAGITAKRERSIAVDKVLDRLDLTERKGMRLRSLSKGLTQRVALAQAIVHQPKILILDEPFSGLDPVGRRLFSEIMSELKEQGTTLFLSSHILSDVEALCTRASIMIQGELKGVYELDALSTNTPRGYELHLGTKEIPIHWNFKCKRNEHFKHSTLLTFDSEELARGALHLAHTEQIPILSYQRQHEKLEDLFVKLVQSDSKMQKDRTLEKR